MVRSSSFVLGLTAIILTIFISLIRKKTSITTETKIYRFVIVTNEADQNPLILLTSETTCPVLPTKTSGKATM